MPVLTSAVNDTFHSLQKRASEGVFQGGKPNEVNTSVRFNLRIYIYIYR